ncbi:MAG: class I SAM-dependent methyltransferase [Micropruina sp.]|nr:class I SAM-dependent methyltransferase [Micropruina sp.]
MNRFKNSLSRIVAVPGRLVRLPQEYRDLHAKLQQRAKKIAALEAKNAEQAAEIVRLKRVIKKLRTADMHRMLPEPVAKVAEAVIEKQLTLMSARPLTSLVRALIDVQLAGVPGIVIEAGTARGGSAIVLATAKSPDRAMKVYDVFGMIPPPSDKDGADVHRRYERITSGQARGGEEYYGYRDNLYDEVTNSFAEFGVPVHENRVELIRGLFQDTIDLHEPVAFAHVDGDWYESTMTCLERIVPWLSVGGRLVIDDYFMWSGCRLAVDEYFAGREEFELVPGLRLQVVRLAETPTPAS